MTSTVFRNAAGLPDEEQVTTARDLVKLAMALYQDFPQPVPSLFDPGFRVPRP